MRHLLALQQQEPIWLPPRVIHDPTGWHGYYNWQDFGLSDQLVGWWGFGITFLIMVVSWLALRAARHHQAASAARARLVVGGLCLLLVPVYAEVDDGDGDTMGFAFIWGFPGFVLLASAPQTRRRMRRPLGWLATALLFLAVIYAQWMQPYFYSLGDSVYAIPWMLTWFAFTLGRPEGKPVEGAWDRAMGLLLWGLMLSAGYTVLHGAIDEESAWSAAIFSLPTWFFAGLLALFAMVEAVLPWNLRSVFFPEHPALHDWKRDQPGG